MLAAISSILLLLAGACAAWAVVDIIAGNRQHMWIMNLVWPITCLYAGPLGLWGYYRVGLKSTHQAIEHRGDHPSNKPFAVVTATAATHCGAGCTLGDILGEALVFAVPLTIFGRTIFGAWIVTFVLAYLIGIVFQYFTIAPIRHLSFKEGIVAALKADTLSLIAWQVGMYGWMAICTFAIFHRELSQASPIFWFMMQIAMLIGFVTSYPVNWWLVRLGIKEKM